MPGLLQPSNQLFMPNMVQFQQQFMNQLQLNQPSQQQLNAGFLPP